MHFGTIGLEGNEALVQWNLRDPIKNRDSIRHGLISLASVFTMGRVVCGFFAIVSTFNGMHLISEAGSTNRGSLEFDHAAQAIGWGILCDCLDGAVARLTGRASDFGRELDSLVDVLTFGMAPALLGYFWGVMPLQLTLRTEPARLLGAAGWIVACVFLVLGVARLARFNLMAERDNSRSYSVGLAIPCAAAVIASIVHFAKLPPNDLKLGLAWLAVMAVLALLMASRVRYETLNIFPVGLRRVAFLLPLACLSLLAVWYYSEQALLIVALGYSISGPLVYVVTLVRRQNFTGQRA